MFSYSWYFESHFPSNIPFLVSIFLFISSLKFSLKASRIRLFFYVFHTWGGCRRQGCNIEQFPPRHNGGLYQVIVAVRDGVEILHHRRRWLYKVYVPFTIVREEGKWTILFWYGHLVDVEHFLGKPPKSNFLVARPLRKAAPPRKKILCVEKYDN